MKWLLCMVLILNAAAAFAQTPSRAWKIADGFGDFEKNMLEELTRIYFSGDWPQLQRQTTAVLRALRFKLLEGTSGNALEFDFQKHYYSVVFVYTGPDRKEEVLRFMVHDPAPEEYVLRLPGIRAGEDEAFYEIFLTADPADELISTYISTREKSELESQLPRFLKQFDPKVLEGLLEAVPPRNRVHAVMSRVNFPFERAMIQIKDVVRKGDDEVTQDFKLLNRPLTRFSFGVVSSIIASSSVSNPRVTIQSGDLTQDPLRGHMPMGVLNIHPFAYDDESEDVSWRERFRFFIGGVLAPEFGLSAGAGIQLVRGFSLNAGVGVLLIDTLKEGETIGEEPVDPQDPFEYGTATVLFFGAGYNF